MKILTVLTGEVKNILEVGTKKAVNPRRDRREKKS